MSADIPTPWTPESLEAAFDSLGISIDKRSIQNWHSGKNKPSLQNLHRLARLVSGKDVTLQRQWTDAFLATSQKRVFRTNNDEKPTEVDAPKEQPVSPPTLSSPTQGKTKPQLGLIGILSALALFAMASLTFYMYRTNKPTVSDIAFCDETRFSQSQKICLENVDIFPADIKMIYTSFKLNNASDGMPFERRWYRGGQMFKTKDGFYDEAWEDYTFLYNPNTHDTGDYVMRVIINNRSETGSFTVLGE